MSDRGFEQKVQEQMEGWQLEPSPSVWLQVQQEVRLQKRRRRRIIWWPLLLICISAGSYWLLSNGSAGTNTHAVSSAKLSTRAAGDRATSAGNDIHQRSLTEEGSLPINVRAGEDSHPNSVPNNTKAAESRTGNDSSLHHAITNTRKDNKKLTAFQKAAQRFTHSIGVEKGKYNRLSQDENARNLSTNSLDQQQAPAVSIAANENDEPANLNASMPSLLLQPMGHPDRNFNQPVTADWALQQKNSKDKKEKPSGGWSWGLNAGTGISGISKGNVFEFGGAQTYAPIFSSSTQFNGGGAFHPPASAITHGVSWSAGAFAEKKLSDRISVRSGLTFSNFSTRILTGRKLDSASIANAGISPAPANAYDGNKPDQAFTNQYHYLEIPLSVKVRLFNNPRLPISWSAGLSYGRLLSTRALRYDRTSGIYFEQDDLYRKSRWALQTAVSVELFPGSAHPLELAPQFNYSFSNLLKDKSSGNQHLWSGGLSLSWYFRKR